MEMKRGRNELCWCGSGKKYKRCHLDRHKQTPLTEEDYLRALRASHNSKYCLHPDAGVLTCGKTIIRAHTIQRSGGLSRIARNGKVYHFLPGWDAAIRPMPPKATLIGYREASTFTGFCDRHDSVTFAEIENNPLLSNQQHTFLLAYRVLCKELYLKKAELDAIPIRRDIDKGRPPSQQKNLQLALRWHIESSTSAMKEVEHYKKQYDDALLRKDFSDVWFYVVRLSYAPDVVCSGIMKPEYDFNGRPLQDLYDLSSIHDHVSFTLLPTDTGGAAVFAWLGRSSTGLELVGSLHALADTDIPHALVRFAFEFLENTFAAPGWWEGLAENARKRLLARTWSGTTAQVRKPDCLQDDGLRAATWVVTSRETNMVF